MAIVWIPISVHARKMRIAISPRFAAMTLLNGTGMSGSRNDRPPRRASGEAWVRCRSLLAALRPRPRASEARNGSGLSSARSSAMKRVVLEHARPLGVERAPGTAYGSSARQRAVEATKRPRSRSTPAASAFLPRRSAPARREPNHGSASSDKSQGPSPSAVAQVPCERLVHSDDVRSEPAVDPGPCLHDHPGRRAYGVEQRPQLAVLADEAGMRRGVNVRAGVRGLRHHLLLGGEVLHDILAEELEQRPDLVRLAPFHRRDERPDPPEELLVLAVDLGMAESERGVPLH